MTVWQVQIGDEWRYATPDTAALVAVARPGNVRLADMPIPLTPRWARGQRGQDARRPATAPRLRAAAKAIQRQKDDAGLFVALVEPVTPEERIEAWERDNAMRVQRDRDSRAAGWRRCRAAIRQLAPEARSALLFRWSVAGCPAEPHFLATLIHAMTHRSSTP